MQALHHVDSDTNDPESRISSNNDLANAQAVRMPAIIGGFVASPLTDCRFGSAGDPDDSFVAEFEAGDQALLEFPDPARADLDLNLIDEDGMLVDASISVEGFARVVAPEAGLYYVRVSAYSGQSAYHLRLDSSQLLDPAHAASLRVADDFVPGEIIVRSTEEMRPFTRGKGPTEMLLQRVSGAPGREQLWRIPEGHAEAVISTLGLHTPSISPAVAWRTPEHASRYETLRVIKALRGQPDIVSASPNYRMKPMRTPNDTDWGDQWFHEAINLPQAWDITTGQEADEEVVVAVIDTGVYREHEDLDEDRLFPTQRFVCDPADSTCDEERSWHGTHVTGIIGAATDNSLGVAGISWGVDILPVWTLNGTGTLNDTLQGIRYAAGLPNDSGTVPSQRADIINLSLGGGGYSAEADELLQEVRELGILVVAAAGNDGTSTIGYPAAYESVLAAGATDRNAERAGYSNYGPRLDLVAPGGVMIQPDDGILSTWVKESRAGTLESGYAFLEGTSMSTAVVSGVLALGRAVNPGLSPGLLLELLESGALTQDLGPTGWDPETGWGEIDAHQAVQTFAERTDTGELAPRISVTPQVLNFGFTGTSLDLRLRNGGDGSLQIEDIATPATWLTVEPHDVTEDGLGLYRSYGQRDALSPGDYESRLRITADNGDQRDIPVGIRVAERDPQRDTVGRVYVLLLDRDDRVVAQTALEPEYGTYRYRFEGVPAGDYRVVAGTNIAGNDRICAGAEACGAWPQYGARETFRVDRDRTGLDFGIAWRPFSDEGFLLENR
ncbi:S8 family serine peptidase [Thioalkalivibrio sp. ALMg3]|uniref:S8 family serine peptidase n=1 Tax=Thioalkalivibrio sp. ALMg3 TaxID=1158163 RepID=UPI000365A642|nr:S8 family serine peptidase [Thioalkalivibrio sp. ALMg3]